MKLQLKQNATNVPLDVYGKPCPNAFVKDTGVNFDFRNQQLNVDWAIYRNEEEASSNVTPLKSGTYVWTREARPSVYAPDILATYSPEIPEIKTPILDVDNKPVLDEEGKPTYEITQEYVAPVELTPLIKGKLLIPRFGAFKDVKNIIVTVDGVGFGEQGDIWIGMHSEWSDYEIIK